MHVCLIGGGGFIGSAFRRYMLDRGIRVTVLGRRPNSYLNDETAYYSVSEHSFDELGDILSSQSVDIIFDFAYSSVPGTSYKDPVKDFSDNLSNIIRHLDFARRFKDVRYVYMSSGGTVYGDSSEYQAFREEDANLPLSPYGITKLACERYVHMYHKLHGLDAVIARPSNIYGPGQQPFRGQGLIATAFGLGAKGEPVQIFGDGEHVRDYLYINDCCEALFALAQLGRSGHTYNIGAGSGMSIRDLIDQIAGVLNRSGLKLEVQAQPQRPFDVHYNVLNIDKITADTGWRPVVDLEAGLTDTWKWIQQNISAILK